MRLLAVLLALVAAGCSKKKPTVVTPPPPPNPPIVKAQVPAVSHRARQAPGPAPAEVAAPPALVSMTTPEERRETLQRINLSVDRARANVTALRNRQLDREGARELGRVESFLRLARASQEGNDLVAAAQYAHRAVVLSEDLLKR